MVKAIVCGLILLALIAVVLWARAYGNREQEARVVCCGECRQGDECAVRCAGEGLLPPGTKVVCYGGCVPGDDCLATCGPTCGEVR